ncbi:N-acetylmuramoyl-L-alanine amidase [Corynebacterium cystitidis]|uniref:N-acetylmuramoyl-L-alanine amidase n=1 Tax=Corynebacterium cystitidis TaxID=35757 RepID=UPI00211E8B30|nr:N-acetylmuramoyl-L-alanine amidase [Corynebacterium cystitidis]
MIQRRRLSQSTSTSNPVLVVLVTAALAITAAFGGNYVMKTQSLGGANVEVMNQTQPLAQGTSVVVEDPAVPSQGESPEAQRTVKEFTNNTPFSMFALTWEGETDTAAFVRAEREDGAWSEWYELDHMYEVEGAGRNGTELIFIEPTTRVQVNMTNVDMTEGGANSLPTNHGDIQPVADVADVAESTGLANQVTDFDIVMIDGGTGTAQNIAPASYEGMPTVITRAGWGARTDLQRNPTIVSPVKTVTVHHTAGSNNYSEAQAPGIVRGIQAYHGATLGWGDVGYNALVDKFGNIYEGRYGGLDRDVMGAHVGGFNHNTWGVSVLGNYMNAYPTQDTINALGELAGWRLAQEGQDPTGSSWLGMSGSFPGSKYSNGQGAMFPNINAHRDFHYNDCPGTHLYNQMGTIRTIAKKKFDSLSKDPLADKDYESDMTLGELSAALGSSGDKESNDNATTQTTRTADGTTTTVHNANTANTANNGTSSIGGLLNGESEAIAATVGTLAAVILTVALANNALPGETTSIAGIEMLPGLTLDKITPYIGTVLQVAGKDELSSLWSSLEPLLGTANGTATGAGGAKYAFYNDGIGVFNPEQGEVHALIGKIADAWLQQGLDLGPLGLPVSDQYAANNGDVRVDFQGGSILYNAEKNTIDINVN